MTREGAQKAVTTSAVIVGMIYGYRRLFEGATATGQHVAAKGAIKQLAGQGPPPPLSQWLVGYGFAFMVIAGMAQANPDFGGHFALLLLVGTVLTQGQQMLSDFTGQLSGATAAGASSGQAYSIGSALGSAAGIASQVGATVAGTGSSGTGSAAGTAGGTAASGGPTVSGVPGNPGSGSGIGHRNA